MSKLRALSAYIGDYMANRPEGTARDAREWMEKTGVNAADATRLAAKGYTPEQVAARAEAAYLRGDERDADRAVDSMLYGPDAC